MSAAAPAPSTTSSAPIPVTPVRGVPIAGGAAKLYLITHDKEKTIRGNISTLEANALPCYHLSSEAERKNKLNAIVRVLTTAVPCILSDIAKIIAEYAVFALPPVSPSQFHRFLGLDECDSKLAVSNEISREQLYVTAPKKGNKPRRELSACITAIDSTLRFRIFVKWPVKRVVRESASPDFPVGFPYMLPCFHLFQMCVVPMKASVEDFQNATIFDFAQEFEGDEGYDPNLRGMLGIPSGIVGASEVELRMASRADISMAQTDSEKQAVVANRIQYVEGRIAALRKEGSECLEEDRERLESQIRLLQEEIEQLRKLNADNGYAAFIVPTVRIGVVP